MFMYFQFSVFLGIIFFLELTAGVLAFVFKDWIKDQLNFFINNNIRAYRDDIDLQNLIDFTQEYVSNMFLCTHLCPLISEWWLCISVVYMLFDFVVGVLWSFWSRWLEFEHLLQLYWFKPKSRKVWSALFLLHQRSSSMSFPPKKNNAFTASQFPFMKSKNMGVTWCFVS